MAISIRPPHNIAAVEQYLAGLERTEGDVDLTLPLTLEEERAGGKAALIQAIITWARRSESGRLITRIKDSDAIPTYLQSLAKKEHGLVAMLMASDVMTADKNSLRSQVLQETHREYSKISQEPQRGGTSCFFLVTNRFSREETAPRYDHITPRSTGPSNIQWFKRELTRHIENSIDRSKAKAISPADCAAIGEIAYELFANAEEWGSEHFDGSEISPNVRGIFIAVHGKSKPKQRDLLEDVRGSPPMERFVSDWYARAPVTPGFLEISVFDAGIGLAERAAATPLNEEVPLDQEYDLVMKCFRKYSSTSNRSSRGLGLYYVMSLLTKTRGFLRYRSGRLSLFRDFNQHQFMPALGRDSFGAAIHTDFREHNIFLFDWKSQSPELVRSPRVDGALFTLLFPLRGSDEQLILRRQNKTK